MSESRETRVTESVLRGYGLIRLPLPDAAAAIAVSPPEQGWNRRVVASGQPLAVAIDYLDTVTWPATRYALFPLDDHWTIVVNNQRGGTEVADLFGHMKKRQPAMAVRVVDHEASFVIRNGFRVRQRYAAPIVEIQADGEMIRSIACANDGGHWTYDSFGAPFPIEAPFDSTARRKRDRFTRENLDALLRSVGARLVTPADLEHAPHFTLLAMTPRKEDWRIRIESDALSTEEADDPAYGYLRRGLGWVDHMATHATSVVSDLGRAILLNPDLEPRCRPALDRARARIGDRAFDREMAQAEALLRSDSG
jgi:hypothetical protein